MSGKILDPANDEDYVNILLHDVDVVLEKQGSHILKGPIKLGEKREGKIKVFKFGKPVEMTGARGTSTSELEGIRIDDVIGSIALKTRNSVYTIGMADKDKENRKVSLMFLRRGYLDFDEKMPDGFYDGGRYTNFQQMENGKMIPRSNREIIVLHEGLDVALKHLLANVRNLLQKVTDPETKIKMLAMFVSNTMGGSQVFRRPETDLEKLCDLEIKSITDNTLDHMLPIGYLTHGVCRHRALLFKFLADRVGIPSRLVRGDYHSAHAWNVVKLDGKFFVVDVMHDPTQIFEENSEKAKIYQRKGLNGVRGGFGGHSVGKV